MLQGYKKIIDRYEKKPSDSKREWYYSLFSSSLREDTLRGAQETHRKSKNCLEAIIKAEKALNLAEIKLRSLECGDAYHSDEFFKNLRAAKNYLKITKAFEKGYSYPSIFNSLAFSREIELKEMRYSNIQEELGCKLTTLRKFLNTEKTSQTELRNLWMANYLPRFKGQNLILPQDKQSIIDLVEINTSFLRNASYLERKQLRQIHQAIIHFLNFAPNENKDLNLERINQSFYYQLIRSNYLSNLINRIKIKQIDRLCKTFDLDKAIDAANQLNANISDDEALIHVHPFIREPLENPKRKKHGLQPEEQISRYISYERFRSALRKSFAETLKEILKFPEGEKEYVILGDGKHRSANWAISHILDLMSIHPPKAVIHKDCLDEYLECHPFVNTIVKIDDASYSGEQVTRYIDHHYANKKVFICIPLMTPYAIKTIEQKLINVGASSFYFKNKGIMMTYKEMLEKGWDYAHVKMLRPNIQQFLNMPIAQLKEGLDPKTIKKVKCWNSEMINAKKTIFQHIDKRASLDEQILNRFDLLSKHLKKIAPFITNEKDLHLLLEKAALLTPRFGINEKIRMNFISKPNTPGLLAWGESRTPTWLASKEADSYSTFPYAMENAVTDLTSAMFKSFHQYKYVIVEPYKHLDSYVQWRKNIVNELKSQCMDIVQKWEALSKDFGLPHIEIIRSNRGLFLLGDNFYGNPISEPTCMKIFCKGKITPFGGSNGAYQFQIQEGVPFTIQYQNRSRDFVF